MIRDSRPVYGCPAYSRTVDLAGHNADTENVASLTQIETDMHLLTVYMDIVHPLTGDVVHFEILALRITDCHLTTFNGDGNIRKPVILLQLCTDVGRTPRYGRLNGHR